MLMSEFLMTRKSVRDFKNKKLSAKSEERINEIIHEVSGSVSGVNYKLYTDSKKIHDTLDGKAGYGGVMIEAPAYIAMDIENEESKSYVMGAYTLEKMITRLKEEGIASCWVTLLTASKEDLQKAFGDDVHNVSYVLAIGYPPRELNFGEKTYSTRIGVNEYVFDGEFGRSFEDDKLENLGFDDLFYYLRMAPSSYNKQPWRFVVKNGLIDLYLTGEVSADSYVDAGIIMYYYDELAKTIHLNGQWDVDIKEEGENIHIASTKF